EIAFHDGRVPLLVDMANRVVGVFAHLQHPVPQLFRRPPPRRIDRVSLDVIVEHIGPSSYCACERGCSARFSARSHDTKVSMSPSSAAIARRCPTAAPNL